MGDIEMQINHSNIADVVLGRIRKYFGKRTRHITEKEKKQYKCYFENEKGVFMNERLARDVIERCKLPEAIELRKKFGYNHDNIMVRQETSIAEKIIKLFPYENIVLNKKFKGTKPDIWFKDLHLTVEVNEGDHEDYETDDEKEREGMLKRRNFKIIKCNPNDPGFDINKFFGELNSYVAKLHTKKQ